MLIRVRHGSTPRDLAWDLGRSVFGTVTDIYRLLVLRLLSVADEVPERGLAVMSFVPATPGDALEALASCAGKCSHTLDPTGREESDVAELQLEGGELVLHLSGGEKAEAVHGDLRVPLSALRGVEVLDDAHGWTGIGVGFKVGMRVPGVATVATVRGHGEKMFVAVHRDTPRGVRVRLEGAPWDEWIVGCADPEAVAATLASAS